ncbi:MAG: hypothetical protein CVU64_03380 [Deltaproteobacteria bacterium HGW-Deltaproteobacteria-21]|nr:MAG: hypothetical protein CVU64_03380 [Deltaproteobacteria bacterium HGW-Deltaproteobacteria-21]
MPAGGNGLLNPAVKKYAYPNYPRSARGLTTRACAKSVDHGPATLYSSVPRELPNLPFLLNREKNLNPVHESERS